MNSGPQITRHVCRATFWFVDTHTLKQHQLSLARLVKKVKTNSWIRICMDQPQNVIGCLLSQGL